MEDKTYDRDIRLQIETHWNTHRSCITRQNRYNVDYSRYTLWNSVLPKRNIDKAIQLISSRHRGFRVLIEESNSIRILSESSQQSRSLESISVRPWFRPLCQIGRWMFAHCTGIERGLVYLSERARWIAYVFGQLYPRYLSSSTRRKHPVGGFIMVKEEAQMLRFSLVAVPLPPNWKETNSFSPIRWRHRRPHEDASSSTNSNVSNSTTFRQKLDVRTITT